MAKLRPGESEFANKNSMQTMDLKEYLELAEKVRKKKERKMPLPLVIILLTPMVIVFCLGIYYVPYMIYIVATSPSAPAPEELEKKKSKVSYDDLMKKRR